MRHITVISLILFVLFSGHPAFAKVNQKIKQDIIKKGKKLEAVEKEIQKKKDEVEAIEKRETSILTDLDNLERALAQKEDELFRIENTIKHLKAKIDAADKKIQELLAEREKLLTILKRRIAAMYKMREGGAVRILFSSNSANDLSRRYKYINVVIDSDAKLLERYNENKERLEAEKQRFKDMQTDMLALKDNVEEKKKEIGVEKNKRLALLNTIRKEKDLHLLAVKELEKTAKDLQTFIDELKKKQEIEASKKDSETTRDSVPFPSTGFGAMKGRLLMPVAGKVISVYGKVEHPKFRTITFNNGIEIEAPLGAEVKSVYKGKVIYSGWLKGYGRIVIIDHGDGFYTLYAHLSKVLKELDNIVEAGEIIAEVGDTGSLEGVRLYFEVRYKGVPKDPLTWLANR